MPACSVPVHKYPKIVEMYKEMPMRPDLKKLPLHQDSCIAEDQLLIRQAVPIPLFEQIPVIREIK